jgi:hypothetical protein
MGSIVKSSGEVNHKYSSNGIYFYSFITGTSPLEHENGLWVRVTKPVWFRVKRVGLKI